MLVNWKGGKSFNEIVESFTRLRVRYSCYKAQIKLGRTNYHKQGPNRVVKEHGRRYDEHCEANKLINLE